MADRIGEASAKERGLRSFGEQMARTSLALAHERAYQLGYLGRPV